MQIAFYSVYDPYPINWRLSWKDWHPQSKRNCQQTHLLLILTWLEILDLQSLYNHRCACLKVSEPTDICIPTLSLSRRLFQSSLLFCMHVLHGICLHMCMHGVMCICVNVCRSQRSVSNVFLDCPSLFLRVALSLALKHTNSARLPVQQLLVFSCLCLPSVAYWVHTTTFSFLRGAGDQKQGLNKHSKHITNQTVSLAFLPSLWTLTNPSTLFTSYTQAVYTCCTIPSGVENVTNTPSCLNSLRNSPLSNRKFLSKEL